MNKYLIVALWIAVVAVAGTGCAKKNNKAANAGKPGFSPAVTEMASAGDTPRPWAVSQPSTPPTMIGTHVRISEAP